MNSRTLLRDDKHVGEGGGGSKDECNYKRDLHGLMQAEKKLKVALQLGDDFLHFSHHVSHDSTSSSDGSMAQRLSQRFLTSAIPR